MFVRESKRHRPIRRSEDDHCARLLRNPPGFTERGRRDHPGRVPAAGDQVAPASRSQSIDDASERNTRHTPSWLLQGPPLSFLVLVGIGFVTFAVVVTLSQSKDPQGTAESPSPKAETPPPKAEAPASDLIESIKALMSEKRAYDTPTQEHDFDAVIKRETVFIRVDPKDTHAFHIRGFAWLGKKDYVRAIADFSAAIRSHPIPKNATVPDVEATWPDVEARCYRALSFLFRGDAWNLKKEPDKAIADFDEAIRLVPDYGAAFGGRANAWSDKQEFANAIRDYEEAIRVQPEGRFEEYINLSWLLATCPEAKFRDGKRAIQLATKACDVSDWKSGWALNALAAAHAETGQFDAAVRYQTKALEDPAYRGPAGDDFRVRLLLYKYDKPYRGPVQHQHPAGFVGLPVDGPIVSDTLLRREPTAHRRVST